MQIYLPFQHSILSPHPLKHFPHHSMIQGHTSGKKKRQGQVAYISKRHITSFKAHHTKTAKHEMLVVAEQRKDTELVSGTSNSLPV